MSKRERETGRERQRERQRERDRDRQREIDRERQIEAERASERQREKYKLTNILVKENKQVSFTWTKYIGNKKVN
jgi:hypothetical protein